MNIMASISTGHNKQAIKKDPNPKSSTSNCRKKTECPKLKQRTTMNILYKATVTSPTTTKKCTGLEFHVVFLNTARAKRGFKYMKRMRKEP